jgi:hypothetical protein
MSALKQTAGVRHAGCAVWREALRFGMLLVFGTTQNIGLNYLTSQSPIWFAGPNIGSTLGEGNNLSLLEFEAIQYKRKGNVITNEGELLRIAKVPKRGLMRRGINQHTLEKICELIPIRAVAFSKLSVVEQYESLGKKTSTGEGIGKLLKLRGAIISGKENL